MIDFQRKPFHASPFPLRTWGQALALLAIVAFAGHPIAHPALSEIRAADDLSSSHSHCTLCQQNVASGDAESPRILQPALFVCEGRGLPAYRAVLREEPTLLVLSPRPPPGFRA
jgi:hypothetical protein